MREPPVTAFTQRREDVVVPACFSDLPATPRTFTVLRQLAARLDTQYRFREIILVVGDSAREAFLPLVEEIADVRLFVVRRGTEYYQRRVIAAEEAAVGHYKKVIQATDGDDYITQDLCIQLMADEEEHLVLFRGFLKEYDR